MSPLSRVLLSGALLGLTGAVALGFWRQGEHLEALSREMEQLRAEVRTAPARGCPVSAPSVSAPVPSPSLPALPPEAFAVRVVQLLEERERARERPEAPAPPSPPALSVEAEATLTRAQQLADAILTSGQMRPEEATELRGLLARISYTEQARAIRQRIIVASNRGALKLPPGTLPHLP